MRGIKDKRMSDCKNLYQHTPKKIEWHSLFERAQRDREINDIICESQMKAEKREMGWLEIIFKTDSIYRAAPSPG